MIKVKEFYAKVEYALGKYGIVKGVDEYINEFLDEHKNIDIINIKYSVGPFGDTHQTCALLIYKEKGE